MKIVPFAAVILVLGLAGCAKRDASIEAATALAEAIYPGELEFHDSHLRKSHYDVTLAVKGDPVTRITFQVDADPADCVPGSRCEARLRQAYETGMARGETLKAFDRAFGACGVAVLAETSASLEVNPSPIVPVIELELADDNQQAALARLSPCLEDFWTANAGTAWMAQLGHIELRILPQPSSGPSVAPKPLTFEASVPGRRHSEPAYSIGVARDRTVVEPADLRFRPYYDLKSRLDKRLSAAAREFLKTQPGGGHVQQISFARDMRLDPDRIDVVRAYIMACSQHRPGQGPCREDIAVAMRYDMTADTVSELSALPVIRDGAGTYRLPELPGR